MPGMQEMRDAAKKKPAQRTPYEQGLVDAGQSIQEIRNLDHEAKNQQRVFGPG